MKILSLFQIKRKLSLWKSELGHLLQHSQSHLIWGGIIVGFLLLFLNMLFGASLYVKSIAQEMKNKVGIYFYIKDDPLLKDKIMTSVLNIRDQLTKEGIEVQFQSKDQAMKFLETRLPDVVKNFEKYDIENPLPPALYISLRDEADYDRVKTVLAQHKHIIADGELDNKEQSLKSQEMLALRALRLSDLVIWATYALMSVLCGIIFVFLMFIMYVTFHKHLSQIQVYKLLGASYNEMMTPYLLYMLCFLGIGFVIFIVGALALGSLLQAYLYQMHSVSFLSFVFSHLGGILGGLAFQVVFMVGISLIVSTLLLYRLIKKA